ncbi:NosD domain-containing protein [Halovivax limisalsi]|uniref:NosD domain-containing protein n=1 Tax=Halovivax limisalsi TaxID=1453760 RepID=UPI001FFC3B9C|nr:NosD domain-containing protein [Halovivax limisalsi]
MVVPVGATVESSASIDGTPVGVGPNGIAAENGDPTSDRSEESASTTELGEKTPDEVDDFAVPDRGTTGYESWYTYRNGVNLANGNLYRSSTDASVGARAGPIEFTRSYNSRASHEPGPLGFGWTHEYAARLDVLVDGVRFVDGDGSEHVFQSAVDGFDTPAGLDARLVATDDGYELRWSDGRTFGFDEGGVLRWTADRNGTGVTLEYTDGALTRIVDDAGQALSISYDADGWIETVEDPLGRTIQYDYDVGDLVSVTGASGETTYEYFENHKLRKISRPTGMLTTVDYESGSDRVRRVGTGLTEVQCARSGVTFAYDYANDSVSYVDGITGTETTVVLNEAGNPASMAWDDETAEWAWDDELNLVGAENASGSYEFVYDAHGNLLERSGPDGTVGYEWFVTETTDRYLSVRTSETDAAGRTTAYEYDDRGNLVAVTNPAGAQRTFEYDATGDRVAATDPAGHRTTYAYDHRGFLTGVTEPTGAVTTYEFDAVGRLLTETTPRGDAYEYTYDDRDALLNVTDPAGNVLEYVYDERGTQTGIVRSVGESGTSSTLSTIGSNVGQSRYDIEIDGDVVTYRSDEHDLVRRLNARGRLASETIDYGPFTSDLDYAYDERGNLVAIATGGGNYTFEYDASDRVSRATGVDGSWLEYAYDAMDRVTQTTASNGVTTTYTYDEGGNVASLRAVDASGGTVLDESYGYDLLGNLETVTDASGSTTQFEYDALDRLVVATYPSGETVEYAYDAIGNRLSKTVNGTETTDYDYDADGTLLQAGDTAYEYDANGSLAVKTVERADGTTARTEYEYGQGGQLERVLLPDGETVSYTYLPDGERASKTTSNGTTFYSYSDFQLLGEYGEDGALDRGYLQGAGLDTPIARYDEDSDEAYFYHIDARNDVRAVTDAAGGVANRYRYEAFGAVRHAEESVANPYRFAARPFDSAVNLYYNRQRYHDPEVGRFTRGDPAGTVAGVNQYVYADNNPATYTDPFGFATWDGGVTLGGVSPGKLGVISIASKGDMSGSLSNGDTGQGCSISGTITTYGLNVELSAIKAEIGAMPLVIGGPTCGESLPGMTIVCGGIAGQLEAAAGVEVGAFACGDTRSGGYSGGAGSAKTGVTAGAGAGVTLFVRIDIADSECSCVDECDSCNEDDDEPPLGDGPSARPPGGDHPDDNHDVSVRRYAARTDDASIPAYGYDDGSIAMLDRGFADEFGDFLADQELPYDSVSWTVPAEELAAYDLLILPSGSLTGLTALDTFEAKLEAYVDGGGSLLVMPQQRGYHWGPVPGDLAAYGWLEDQSCQFDSVGIDATCPAFASEAVGGESSLNVDGYFTDYPSNAEILLTRTKNAQPAMLAYDRGAGQVIATTAYSDWAYGHHAASSADERILRDTIRWARSHDDIPTYNRGEDVDLHVEATSYVDLAVERTDIRVRDPDGDIVDSVTVTDPVAALSTANLSAALTIPTDAQYGIWDLEYVFETDAHGPVQRVVERDSLAITRYEDGDDGWRASDSNVSVSINSDAERYALGSNAAFTITAHNRGDREENVTLWWSFPHNARYGNASVYGSGGTHPGETSNLTRQLQLGPNGGGNDEATFTVEIPVVNADGRDRLWLEYAEERNGELDLVGRASRGFYTFEPSVAVTMSAGAETYTGGQTVPVDVELSGTGVENATVVTRIVAADRSLHFRNETVRSVDGSTTLSYAYALPSPTVDGRYSVVTEVLDARGEKIGFQTTGFDVPLGLAFDASIPETIGASSDLAFTVENVDTAPFDDALVDVSLVDPAGTVVWSDAATSDVGRNETKTVAFQVDVDDLSFGTHTLLYVLDAGASRFERRWSLENDHAVDADFDRARYRQRESAALNATISNRGRFETAFDAVVTAPAADFETVRTVELAPGDREYVTVVVPLPADIQAGEHDVAVTLVDGSNLTETYSFVVPDSELVFDRVDETAAAGTDVEIVVGNRGGVDTDAACAFELIGPQGIRLDEGQLADTVLAGETATTTVRIPDQAVSGGYFVTSSCTDGTTGASFETIDVVAVDGLDADATAGTDADVYGTGDTVTVSADIANNGAAIADGRLRLEIADPSVSEGSDASEAADGIAASAPEADSTERAIDDSARLDGVRSSWVDGTSWVEQTIATSGMYSIATGAVTSASDGGDSVAATGSDGPTATELDSSVARWVDVPGTITDDVVWEDEVIVLNESLVIDANGSVTMRNATLRFDVASEGEFGVEVRDGGTLDAFDGSTITSHDEGWNPTEYSFTALPGATVSIRDSTVRDVGADSETPTSERGLYVAANDVVVENATIENVRFDVILEAVDGVAITNSTIREPLSVNASTGVRIEGNAFEDGSGVDLSHSNGNLVAGNAFGDLDAQYTISLENASDNVLRANTFGKTGGVELVSSSYGNEPGTRSVRNTIADNAFYQTDTYGNDADGITIEAGSTDTVVENNTLVGTDREAILVHAPNATIANNTIREVEDHGIRVTAANATLADNAIERSDGFGILLDRTVNATLRSNDLVSNGIHINGHQDGVPPYEPGSVPDRRYYEHDIDGSNAVDGGPFQYLVDQTGGQIVLDGGAAWLLNATDVTVTGDGTAAAVLSEGVELRDLNASADAYFGVFVAHSDGTTVSNVTSNGNAYGLAVLGASQSGPATYANETSVTDSRFSANRRGSIYARNVGGFSVRNVTAGTETRSGDRDVDIVGGESVTVADLALDERGSFGGYGTGVSFDRTSNSEIRDSTVRGYDRGIDVEASWSASNVTVQNVTTTGSDGTGIFVRTADSTIADSRAFVAAGTGIRANGDHSTVARNNVSGAEIGINTGITGGLVADNEVTGAGEYAIRIQSPDGTASGNVVRESATGIVVDSYAGGTVLTDNVLAGDTVDVQLSDSDPVTMRNNTLAHAGLAFDFGSYSNPGPTDYDHDIDESNAVRGEPLTYLFDEHDVDIDVPGRQTWIVNSSNVTVDAPAQAAVLFSSETTVRNAVVSSWRNNGIEVSGSTNTTISNATVADTGTSIYDGGISVSESSGTTIRDANVSGNAGDGIYLYAADATELSDVTVDGNGHYGIYLNTDVTASTVTNVTVSNHSDATGIYFGSATGNLLTNVTSAYNARGIYVSASGNEFRNVTSSNNDEYGIRITEDDNVISDSTADANGESGFHIYNAGYTTLSNLTATANGEAGLAVQGSHNNVTNSTFGENDRYGVHFTHARNNLFTRNYVTDNAVHGAYLEAESFDNLLYDNYFDNPAADAEAEEHAGYWGDAPSENRWNVTKTPTGESAENVVGGPFYGGNYWATYDGSDADADGIGDTNTPYTVSGSLFAGDHNPLVFESDENASRVVWATTESIDVAAGETVTVDVEVPASQLEGEGKRVLSATLDAATNQTVASSNAPFYVLDGETSLTMATDARRYATGDTVRIEGALTNDGAASETYDLAIEKNGTPIHEATVTLGADERHDYALTTVADGPFTLAATAGDVRIDDEVAVAEPSVDATAVAPEVVGLEPFPVGAQLENDGDVPVDLTVAVDPDVGTIETVTLEPGERTRVTDETAIADDTTFTIVVSGDVEATLTETVTVGESAATTVSPAAVYAPGTIVVPYTVENTGELDATFDVEFAVGNETGRETVYVAAGANANGSVAFDLEAGTHTLAYETPFETGDATVEVRDRDQLVLSADVPANATDGTLEMDLAVENVGSNDLNGTIVADTTVSSAERGFDVAAGETDSVTVTVPIPASVRPGAYDVSIEATAGDDILARVAEPFEVRGPQFELEATPGRETFELGELATWNYTVYNAGDAEGRVALAVSATGMSEGGAVQRDAAWLAPGERRTLRVDVPIADDVEAGAYDASYELADDGGALLATGETTFDVAGANVSVSATLDRPAYEVGENATLTLSITNERPTTIDLFARTQFNGFDERTDLSLGGGASETVTVDVPITEGTDEKIFFGVYHADGRSLHIDGRYAHERTGNVTLYTDADRYEPGESVTVTVEPRASGELVLAAPWNSWSANVTDGVDETFEFEVPPSRTGTYYVHYAFENETRSYPFDVDGYGARVTGARFGADEYRGGETVDLELELAPSRDVLATVTGTLVDESGEAIANASTAVALETGGTDARLSIDVPADAAGVHAISYEITADVEDEGGAATAHAAAVSSRQVLAVNGIEYLEIESAATNRPPVAAVDYAPSDPTVGEEVTFDASHSSDPDGSIAAHEWDFDGDGRIDAVGATATTAFDAAGTHAVTLSVTDDDGSSDETTVTVPVTEADDDDGDDEDDDGDSGDDDGDDGDGDDGDTGDDDDEDDQSSGDTPPTAAIQIDPDPATVGESVTFSAGNSSYAAGELVAFEWIIDGRSYAGETVSETFDVAGTVDVELAVTAADGETAAASTTLVVREAADEPPDDGDADDETPGDGDDDDGGSPIPGFGAAAAILALLWVSLLSRRRNRA